ncbi:MAG: endonuclease/exonuclease/phosphatase family protein [Fuerstiella sp.]
MSDVWLSAVLLFLVGVSDAAEPFRIATFNVNYGNLNGREVLDAIAEADADILCLQETTVKAESFLRQQLATTYPEFHSAGHQGKYFAERFVFASRIKPKSLRFVPPSNGLFGFYIAEFEVNAKPLRVVNAHLTPVSTEGATTLAGVLAGIARSEDTRASEAKAIVEHISDNSATIVLGDFNSLSTFQAPQALAAAGLVDSFASVHSDADRHPTWHWPTRPLPVRLRIDYIFHSRHLKTKKSAIVKRGNSDHFPVVSELVITD